MSGQKKILIFYTSIGLGHRAIAQNIGSLLSDAGYQVRLEDVLEVQKGYLVDVGTFLHQFVNKYLPFVWSFLYKSGWLTNITLPWRVKLAGRNFGNARRVINDFDPDLVITTQTTASAVVAYLRQQGLYRGKFGIAFSDFHFHRYWLYDEADFYLANIIEQKTEMVRLGVAEEKIFVCGVTLHKPFSVDTEQIRERFGIGSNDKVALVGSGSLGTNLNESVLPELLSIPDCKVLIFCGKNKNLYNKLIYRYQNFPRVKVLGFYSPLDELYAIADIFITKPGGLSVAEALRFNLPMVITHRLPGQEELNYQYLFNKELVMPFDGSVAEIVRVEFETGQFRADLAKNPARLEVLPKTEQLCGVILSSVNPVEKASKTR